MNQQERLKKIFEENAEWMPQGNGITETTFIRVASELLEEREKCQCGLTLNVTYGAMSSSGLRVINFQITTKYDTRYRTSKYHRTRYCL